MSDSEFHALIARLLVASSYRAVGGSDYGVELLNQGPPKLAQSIGRTLGMNAPEGASVDGLRMDRLLSPQEAASRLGVTTRWLYRNAKRLPFTRKLTARTLRFHEAGLERFIREKRP